MKLTRRKLNIIIETFIAGPEGVVDLNDFRSDVIGQGNLAQQEVKKIAEKVLNHHSLAMYKEKLKDMLLGGDISFITSGLTLAHSLGAMEEKDWDRFLELKKVLKYMEKVNQDMSGAKNSIQGMQTSDAYAKLKQAHEDQNFENRLKSIVGVYIDNVYDYASNMLSYLEDPYDFDVDVLVAMEAEKIAEDLSGEYPEYDIAVPSLYDRNELGKEGLKTIDDMIEEELHNLGLPDAIGNELQNYDQYSY